MQPPRLNVLTVTDDAAGAARLEAAAASKARKEAEAAELAAENKAMRETIQNTAARTDDDGRALHNEPRKARVGQDVGQDDTVRRMPMQTSVAACSSPRFAAPPTHLQSPMMLLALPVSKQLRQARHARKRKRPG